MLFPILPMNQNVLRLLALALSIALIPLSVLADEITLPPIGQTATYLCHGDFGGEYRYTVKSADKGVVRYRLKVKSNARELIMPIWFLGTSLYLKDEGDGYGTGRMTDGLEQFDGLRSLAVGAEFAGNVREITSGKSPTVWSYSIKVSDKRRLQDHVLGDVEVYVINERRTSGSRWSERESFLSPTDAELVSSKYSDSEGNHRECRISNLRRAE